MTIEWKDPKEDTPQKDVGVLIMVQTRDNGTTLPKNEDGTERFMHYNKFFPLQENGVYYITLGWYNGEEWEWIGRDHTNDKFIVLNDDMKIHYDEVSLPLGAKIIRWSDSIQDFFYPLPKGK